jgi:hypothetical protein
MGLTLIKSTIFRPFSLMAEFKAFIIFILSMIYLVMKFLKKNLPIRKAQKPPIVADIRTRVNEIKYGLKKVVSV